MKWVAFLVAAIVIIGLGSCSPASAPYGLESHIYAPVPPLGVSAPEVEVVARAFLPRGTEPHEDYAFIGYLLFPNRLSSNLEQRRAAAAAFLCLFDDVGVAEDFGIVRAKMAVFFAPVEGEAAAEVVRRHRDVELFLEIYDYFRAERLTKDLGLDVAGVYLVGYVPSLPRGPDGRVENLLQLNLSRKSPERIEAALLALDKEFTIAAWEEAAAGDTSVLTVLRRVFDSLGRMVVGPPAEAAEPARCL